MGYGIVITSLYQKSSLSSKIQKLIIKLTLVLHTSLVKKLQGEESLWEIRSRISDGKHIARVMFTIEAGEMVLLHGFIKKSQKTPRKDLRLARKRNKLWKGSSKSHE